MKKSKSRTEMRSKIAERIQGLGGEPTEELTGQEAVNAVMGLHVVEPAKIVTPIEPKPQIVLYLRDGVNPAEKNFTKYPNEIHSVIKDRLEDMSEGILYVYLWRQSWGFGRNYCRVSHKTVVKGTLIRSRSTAQKAMNALIDKCFVVKALTEEGDLDVDQTGALYRVLTPSEVTAGRTEEGVSLDDLPTEGVLMISIPINGTLINTDKQGDDDAIPIDGTPNHRYTDNRYTDDKHTSIPITGIPINGTSDVKAHDEKTYPTHTDERYTDNHTPLKEDSLKDSLSPDPVKLFYTGIGQKHISDSKREKGNEVVSELQTDNFSLEDIAFAAEWTPKNAKKEVYDMEILKHTIGQALAARDADKVANESARKEAARAEVAEEERRRLEGEIQEMRSRMTEDELVELREKALEEIRNTDEIKEQFITEMLITAKENEILLRGKPTNSL